MLWCFLDVVPVEVVSDVVVVDVIASSRDSVHVVAVVTLVVLDVAA